MLRARSSLTLVAALLLLLALAGLPSGVEPQSQGHLRGEGGDGSRRFC